MTSLSSPYQAAPAWLQAFVQESNRIEGINTTRPEDIRAHEAMLDLAWVTVPDLEAFVSAVAPGNVLREAPGLDVRVGNYYPPPGGPEIRTQLESLLNELSTTAAFLSHLAYESLHPFTDGNGRSGRALWLWQMRAAKRGARVIEQGFLRTFAEQAVSCGYDLFYDRRSVYYRILAGEVVTKPSAPGGAHASFGRG